MNDFQTLFLPLSDQVFRYALRLTQNEKDAEDLVQDSFLRAFDKFHQYQFGTSPLAWLLTIARSIFINNYRKKKREVHQINFEDMERDIDRVQPEAGSLMGGSSLPENPEEYLFRHVLDADLKRALENLPLHYREILILVDVEELSYKEAASVLHLPTGTVMSRLHRARKIMKEQLRHLAIKKGIIKPKVARISTAGEPRRPKASGSFSG